MSKDKAREFWVGYIAECIDKNMTLPNTFVDAKAYAALEAKLKERDEFIEVRGKHIIEIADERDALKAKLAECVAALEFYADGGNWNTLGGQYALITGSDLDGKHLHGGKLAREVLAKVKK